MTDQSDCVFDRIIAGDVPGHFVLDEPEVVAFLDVRPVFKGHTLVVPRRHYATITEMPPVLMTLVWDAGRRLAAAQREALDAEGNFFGLNHVVSQSVAHVHLHVVPRRRKDGLRGFFWPRMRYESEDEAATVAASIRAATATVHGEGRGPTSPGVPGTPLIRDAVANDVPRLAQILAGGTIRGTEDPSDLEPYRRALEDIDATPGSAVLVAEVDGQVVGMCQLVMFRHLQERGGLCAEIESMHVAADRRSGGIGGRLLQAAVERARAAGCYRVQLTSNRARTDAHRFYLRHGFEATHEGFKLYLTQLAVPDPASRT